VKLLVTGANGSLGHRFVRQHGGKHDITAVVRSAAAAQRMQALPVKCIVLDLHDNEAFTLAASACDVIVNFVGIIRESAQNSYYQAHEMTAAAILRVADTVGLQGVISLSIVGADACSENLCLQSRGKADQLFADSSIATTVLRLPMVLGEGDMASLALLKKASSTVCFDFRVNSIEQPIYAGDVIAALDQLLDLPIESRVLQLGGPESLRRRQLIKLAGSLMGRSPMIQSLPLSLGKFAAGWLQRLMSSPPVTIAMLELLDHDDVIDNADALQALAIDLTPLADMLASLVENFQNQQQD
jgi:uncharacterized protein YbjT (DUF2867 family)